MSCQISLGPNDDFEVITPQGRRVYVPISPHGIQLLWQTVWNATAERDFGPSPARAKLAERQAEWDRIEAENAAWNEELERQLRKRQEARKEAERARRVKRLAGVDIALVNFQL